MSAFRYSPSKWVPFRDVEALERCRRIRRADITRHPNPDFQIRVLPDADFEMMFVSDLFHRIKSANDARQKLVLILPNPIPWYRHVAALINRFRVRCDTVHVFAMDEYANEDGQIAPIDWPQGLGRAMMRFLISEIEPDLRPPERQVHWFSDDNLNDYGKMISDAGEADMIYTGPGWTGHLAFVEPDAPEFDLPLEQWKNAGPRVCTLSPFTLAQSSLHGSFGMSGDIAAVPPKGATIGPAQVIAAKNRMDINAFTVHGTATTWQRLITRLVAHGPVTPRLPTSIHQTLRTDFYISETIAADIEPDYEKGY